MDMSSAIGIAAAGAGRTILQRSRHDPTTPRRTVHYDGPARGGDRVAATLR